MTRILWQLGSLELWDWCFSHRQTDRQTDIVLWRCEFWRQVVCCVCRFARALDLVVRGSWGIGEGAMATISPSRNVARPSAPPRRPSWDPFNVPRKHGSRTLLPSSMERQVAAASGFYQGLHECHEKPTQRWRSSQSSNNRKLEHFWRLELDNNNTEKEIAILDNLMCASSAQQQQKQTGGYVTFNLWTTWPPNFLFFRESFIHAC